MLSRIRAARGGQETEADVHPLVSLRKDPSVVGTDFFIKKELHHIGTSVDSFVPSHDGVQGHPLIANTSRTLFDQPSRRSIGRPRRHAGQWTWDARIGRSSIELTGRAAAVDDQIRLKGGLTRLDRDLVVSGRQPMDLNRLYGGTVHQFRSPAYGLLN